MLKLRFSKEKISEYASRYDYKKENHIEIDIAPRIQKNKYLTKKDLIDICDWKTVRTRSRVANNDSRFVKEVTKIAFATKSEKLKIEILTLMEGISWPTASVILHFGTNYKYPILDFRALWSLKTEVPNQYTFPFWMAYTKYCRDLAKECKIDLRTLDRALWKYSEERQP